MIIFVASRTFSMPNGGMGLAPWIELVLLTESNSNFRFVNDLPCQQANHAEDFTSSWRYDSEKQGFVLFAEMNLTSGDEVAPTPFVFELPFLICLVAGYNLVREANRLALHVVLWVCLGVEFQ